MRRRKNPFYPFIKKMSWHIYNALCIMGDKNDICINNCNKRGKNEVVKGFLCSWA